MSKLKAICYVFCLALLLTMVGGMVSQSVALAVSDGTPELALPMLAQESSPDEEVELTCQYPAAKGRAGTSFTYEVELLYKGGEAPRYFEFQVDIPDKFTASITQGGYSSGSAEIPGLMLDPQKSYAEKIKLTVNSYAWLPPEPGEYDITLELRAGEVKGDIELKAIVTEKPDLELTTVDGRLNTEATADEDNYLSMVISNTGSAELKKITFSSSIRGTPPGWSVTFDPEEIDSLAIGSTREVEVNIKPARKTIAGDYMITISAEPESKDAYDSLEVRTTVLTPTIWGWLGVVIVVLVIAGLAVMFMRLGRR